MGIKARINAVLLTILGFLIIVLTVGVLGTAKFNTPSEFELIQLNSGWTISRGNEYHYIESLVDSYT